MSQKHAGEEMRCDCCGGRLPPQEIWELHRSDGGPDCDGSVDAATGRCRAYADDSMWEPEEREITIDDLTIDRYQGRDDQDRKFGYVHTGDEDDGGYFFTWMPTLEETLGSLDADQQDEPTFEIGLAREYLESKISDKFTE